MYKSIKIYTRCHFEKVGAILDLPCHSVIPVFRHISDETWISLRPVGQAWSNIIWSIIRVGAILDLPCHSVIPVFRHISDETWISLRPVGQAWSNIIWSIIRVGERLHKVLETDWIKTLVCMATESAHWLIMGKTMSPPFLCCCLSDLFQICR